MPYSIEYTDVGDPAIRAAIVDGLVAFNDRQTGIRDFRPLALAIQAPDGTVMGGLWGKTAYGWLFVELLFVPESLRQKGIGRDLMRRRAPALPVRPSRSVRSRATQSWV